MTAQIGRISGKIVAITGAGISVASGLPTIRKSYCGVALRDMFTIELYRDTPDDFFTCYKEVLKQWSDASPSQAHFALAVYNIPIITQNVDGLHQKAGSRKVIELHGNIREMICTGCGSLFHADQASVGQGVPRCPACGKSLRPNMVLVGEEVHHYAAAVDVVAASDVLIVIGTRLGMSPVKELPTVAVRNGGRVITINEDAETEVRLLLEKLKTPLA